MIVNVVGFETIVKREIVRTFAIINQVIWPPVIQTLLYVFIFGLAIGTLKPSLWPAGYEHRPTQQASTSPSVPPTVKRSTYRWPVKRHTRGRAKRVRADTVRRRRRMAAST